MSTIVGTPDQSGAGADLTAVGLIHWRRWDSAAQNEMTPGGGPIGTFSAFGGGTVGIGGGATFSYTNGVSPSSDTSGGYQANSGFVGGGYSGSITMDGTNVQTIKLYLAGIFTGGGDFFVQLSDASASYSHSFTFGSFDACNVELVVTPGTTGLTLDWTWTSTAGAAAIQAAAFESSVAGGTTVALTGQSMTASTGTASVVASVAMTGSSSTLSAGTMLATASLPLSGSSSTLSPGTLTSSVAVALSGSSETESAGTLTPALVAALTGSAETESTGTLSPALAASLSGAAETETAGTLSPSLALSLTGASTTNSAGTTLANDDVALSGQFVTLAQGDVLPPGALPLTGSSETISQGSVGVVASHVLTGQQITMAQGTVAPTIGVALAGQQVTTSQGTVGIGARIVALLGQAISMLTGFLTPPAEPYVPVRRLPFRILLEGHDPRLDLSTQRTDDGLVSDPVLGITDLGVD